MGFYSYQRSLPPMCKHYINHGKCAKKPKRWFGIAHATCPLVIEGASSCAIQEVTKRPPPPKPQGRHMSASEDLDDTMQRLKDLIDQQCAKELSMTKMKEQVKTIRMWD